MGTVTQECSPACLIRCSSFTLRIGSTNRWANGRSWGGDESPLLVKGGGSATGGAMRWPLRHANAPAANMPKFRRTTSALCTSLGGALETATASRTLIC